MEEGLRPVVFVLGLFDTGYTVAKMLCRSKVRVLGIASRDSNEIGRHSKSFSVREGPSIQTDPDQFFQFLIDCLKCYHSKNSQHRPILIPCSDDYVFWISDHRSELQKYFLFQLPDLLVTQKFRTKESQDKLANDAGLSTPKTWVVDRDDEKGVFKIPAPLLKEVTYPVFLKGSFSNEWSRFFSEKGFVCENKKELFFYLNLTEKSQKQIVIQEIIFGDDSHLYEFSGVVMNNEILAKVTTQKLSQFPPSFGVGAFVRMIEHSEIERLALEFIKKSQLSGIFNIEFKVDSKKRIPFYIETNLRCWQQIELSYYLGFNLPLILVNHLLIQNERVTINQKNFHPLSKEPIFWIDPVQHAYSLATSMPLNLLSIFKFFWIYFSDIKKASIISCFYRDDWKPFLYKIKFGIYVLHNFKIWYRRYFLRFKSCKNYKNET